MDGKQNHPYKQYERILIRKQEIPLKVSKCMKADLIPVT